MRHLNKGRKLNRTGSHRVATGRNLVASLFKQFGQTNREYIVTTLAKAKEFKSLAERLITIAKEIAALPATEESKHRRLYLRRRLTSMMGAPAKVQVEKDGELHDTDLVKKLIDEIAPRYADRKGGYTRVIKTGAHRLGNGANKVLLMFVAGQAPAATPEPVAAGEAK